MRTLDLATCLPRPRKTLREALPNLADRAESLGIDPDVVPETTRVLGTRRAAKDIVESQGGQPDVLNADGIDVASSSFLHELRKAWPDVRLANANGDVQDTWDLVTEHLSGGHYGR